MPVVAQIGGGDEPAPKPKQPPAQTVQQPATPTATATPRVIEPAGFGAMPWDNTGVQAPSPILPQNKPKPTTGLDLHSIDASRGVIGMIRQQAKLQGIPAAIALAVAKQESGYRQEAVSSAGAIGIMQLMPSTAQGLGVDPNNWQENIRGGVRLLATEYHQYGNWADALRAYNGGPGAVTNPPAETQAYVPSVLAIAKQISGGQYSPAGGSTGIVQITAPLPGNPVVTSGFGPRSLGGVGDFHEGVDLAAPQGTPIHAMIAGKVTYSAYNSGSGNTVTVQDKTGRLWSYFHMVTTPLVKDGQRVKAGDQLGNVGSTGESTGPHLDIHLMVNGKYVNPMAVIRKAYKAGWDKMGKTTLSMTDFLAPGQGGVNGSGQGAAGGTAGGDSFLPGTGGAPLVPPQTVDAAVVPGGQTAMPSNAQAWQKILDSGATSQETKNLAQRAGAMTQQPSPALSEVYNNPG